MCLYSGLRKPCKNRRHNLNYAHAFIGLLMYRAKVMLSLLTINEHTPTLYILDCGYSTIFEILNKRMRAARKTVLQDFRNPLYLKILISCFRHDFCHFQ